MDYTKVLKRAWHIMRNYRAVWIFGIVLALTTISWGTAVWLRDGGEDSDGVLIRWEISAKDQQWLERNFGVRPPRTFTLTQADLQERGVVVLEEDLPERVARRLLAVAMGLAAVLITLLIVVAATRYGAEAALIKMVDGYEETGKAHTVRQGLRLGWSIAAWRLFCIDLVVFPVLVLLTSLLFVPALIPVSLVMSGNPLAILIGAILALGLVFLAVAAVIIAWTAGPLWVRLARRACALDGLGVIDSLRRGYSIIRQQPKEVAPVWLALVAVELTYAFLVSPVVVALMASGVIVGGLATLVVGSLARQVMGPATAWVLAGALGVTIFILLLMVPLAVLGGLREVFQSSTWTLAYRELRAVEGRQPTPAVEFDEAGLELAPST
jgi:hypothetical protein